VASIQKVLSDNAFDSLESFFGVDDFDRQFTQLGVLMGDVAKIKIGINVKKQEHHLGFFVRTSKFTGKGVCVLCVCVCMCGVVCVCY